MIRAEFMRMDPSLWTPDEQVEAERRYEALRLNHESMEKWRQRSALKCQCTCGKCCNHRRESVRRT